MKNSKVYLEPRVLDVEMMLEDGFRIDAWCGHYEHGCRRRWTVDLTAYPPKTKHTDIVVDCECGQKNIETRLAYAGKHSGGSGSQR